MIYALNIFNLLETKKSLYKEYSVEAGKIIFGKGGRVVASGWKPIRKLRGDTERKYFIVVEFPNKTIFQEFLDEADKKKIHLLRENSTSEYIWTLYENWNIKDWINN